MTKGLVNFIRRARDYSGELSYFRRDKITMDKIVTSFLFLLGFKEDDIINNFLFSIEGKTERSDLVVNEEKKPILAFFYYYSDEFDKSVLTRVEELFSKSNTPIFVFTNGFFYSFFSDLDENRILDKSPFLSIDMRNPIDPYLMELFKITKDRLNFNYVPTKKTFVKEVSILKDDFHRKTYCGEENAENDWAMTLLPHEMFWKSHSYNLFKETDSLYLYGHRGSGKTAFIKMLDHEIINKRENVPYDYSNTLNQRYVMDGIRYFCSNYILSLLDRKLQYIGELQLVEHLKSHWHWIIGISSMFSILRADREHYGENPDLKIIFDYLLHLVNRIDESITLDKLALIVAKKTDKIIENDNYNYYFLLKKLVEGKYSGYDEYRLAKESLKNYLNNKKRICLVMIDSIDFYDSDDESGNAIINAIIEAAKEVFSNWMNNRILVKVAFPSEIFEHLKEVNPDHGLGNKLFIEWSYDDLVIMIAKRYYRHFCIKSTMELDSVVLNSLNDYKNAREFLMRYLPEKILSNTTKMEIETLSFIIMHTHKKPRQFIYVFNIILTLADYSDLKKYPSYIYQGTHLALDEIVKGTLNVYDNIRFGSGKLIRSCLFKSPNNFDSDYLGHIVGIAAKGRSDFSIKDIKELLIASGVLGLEIERGNLPNGKVILRSDFQYQVPNILFPTENSRYVIHPMFYPSLEIYIDQDKLVYPSPAEQSINEIEALKRVGIIL